MDPAARNYWLVSFLVLRLLGLIYFVAFLILWNQVPALLGSHGLLPISNFLDDVELNVSHRYVAVPSLFWLSPSDGPLRAVALLGLLLSLALLLGVTNAVLQFVLWVLYTSVASVGQIFYGYGWEMLLLELGFLSIFLCPVRAWRPWSVHASRVSIVLLRWLAFRLMFGAGLIKLRGDPCWRDLTCLGFHYETQPNPSPLSWVLHHFPSWFHTVGVLYNHLAELVAPLFVFGPRPARLVSGVILVSFQILLILSGNLSFLNWLTLTVCLSCFDDDALARLFPARLRERVQSLPGVTRPVMTNVTLVYAVVVALLSINPVVNMFSRRQLMNASFDPLHLVNTYGAFGHVGKERHEVVVLGEGEDGQWREYGFPCKPGDIQRRHCLITPYHYRLDWQLWFAAMSTVEEEPWLVHLAYKLLHGDREVKTLISEDPYPDKPPKRIRMDFYRYRFSKALSEGWWERQLVGSYLKPITAEEPAVREYLEGHGLLREESDAGTNAAH